MCVAVCAFTDKGWQRYLAEKGNDFDGFLNKAMRQIGKLETVNREQLRQRLLRAMGAASTAPGDLAFRRRSANGGRGPINKALFESLTVAFDERTDDELRILGERKEELKQAYLQKLEHREVLEAIMSSTGNTSKVRRRFLAMSELLGEVLTGSGGAPA